LDICKRKAYSLVRRDVIHLRLTGQIALPAESQRREQRREVVIVTKFRVKRLAKREGGVVGVESRVRARTEEHGGGGETGEDLVDESDALNSAVV
jgi:hypothetical protein